MGRDATRAIRPAIAIAALVSLLSCGRQPAPDPAGVEVEQAAGMAGASNVPDESAEAPQAEPPPASRRTVRAVDFEQLVARLPELGGWTRTDPHGENLAIPVAYSRAEVAYRRGDSRIDLEFVDTGLSDLLLAPLDVFLASGFSERWSGGFRQAIEVGGDPGYEEWSADTRQGEVTRVAGGRYVIRAFGRGVDDLAPVRSVVAAVSTSGLPAR